MTPASRVDGTMMPTPYDAWVLARVMSDQPLNGELATMTEPWHTLATKLAAQPSTDRGSILEIFASGQTDPKAVIEAIANQDGTGPAPVAATAPPRPAGLLRVRTS
jgi:hypothetical protein